MKKRLRIDYQFTKADRGGFGVLGNGIKDALLKAGHQLVDKDPDIIFRYGVASILQDTRRKYPEENSPPLVFYTVWESSRYPRDWAEIIRACKVDLVLTATKFTQRSLKDIDIKSKVWHHGVDDRWSYKPRRDDDVFTFVHYNAYEWRKGWEFVLAAMMEEFKIDEPVKLIMKARERGDSVWIIEDSDQGVNHPLIEEVIGHITDEEMVDLMERADCGVFPVKGEGWFLPSMECAAQGIPVILPKQMGLIEQWIEPGYIELGIDGWINASPRYPGYMMYPSVSDLRKKMRWCFENQERLKIMGRVLSREVHKKFNWNKITKDLESYFNLVLKEKCTQ